MRFVQLTLALAAAMTLFSASMVFAHERPCAAYEATCKTDPSVTGATDKKAKWQAMHACVAKAAAADTANGQKCTAMMEKHHHHHMENNAAAPATPSAQ